MPYVELQEQDKQHIGIGMGSGDWGRGINSSGYFDLSVCSLKWICVLHVYLYSICILKCVCVRNLRN